MQIPLPTAILRLTAAVALALVSALPLSSVPTLADSLEVNSGPAAVAAQESHTCQMAFEVTVYDGPSAPLSVAGALVLRIDANGAVTGELGPGVVNMEQDDTSAILPTELVPVTGRVNGRSVNLIFHLVDGQEIFGSGMATDDLSACDGTYGGSVGGPALGPQPEDHGDWLGGFCVLVPSPLGGVFTLCLPG